MKIIPVLGVSLVLLCCFGIVHYVHGIQLQKEASKRDLADFHRHEREAEAAREAANRARIVRRQQALDRVAQQKAANAVTNPQATASIRVVSSPQLTQPNREDFNRQQERQAQQEARQQDACNRIDAAYKDATATYRQYSGGKAGGTRPTEDINYVALQRLNVDLTTINYYSQHDSPAHRNYNRGLLSQVEDMAAAFDSGPFD